MRKTPLQGRLDGFSANEPLRGYRRAAGGKQGPQRQHSKERTALHDNSFVKGNVKGDGRVRRGLRPGLDLQALQDVGQCVYFKGLLTD